MHKQRVKVYGERNTGTRVLEQALQQNFNVQILPGHGTLDEQTVLSDIKRYQLGAYEGLLFREALYDDDILQHESEFLGWKHACPPLPKIERYAALSETLFLIITKDPLDWLLSFYQRPYHVLYQNKLNFSEFIRHYWLSLRCEHLPWAMIKNPIQLYLLKLEAYQKLFEHMQALDVACMHIPYLDLIRDFSGVMAQLAIHLKSKTSSWVIPTRSTKDQHLTFLDYRKKYLAQDRFEQISTEDMAFIHAELDDDLLSYWGY